MTSIQDKTTIAVALALPATASVVALTVPGSVAPTTALVFVALAIGTAAIGLNAWKNAQARSGMAQLIHETDTAPSVSSVPGGTGESRREAWERRGEGLARTGTIRAFLALSLAVTFGILYAWMA